MRAALLLLALGLVACETDEARDKRRRQERLDAPCSDTSVLLATTTGSPSLYECPSRHHRMRVQAVTVPSREEIGALVFCECERAAPARPADPARAPGEE